MASKNPWVWIISNSLSTTSGESPRCVIFRLQAYDVDLFQEFFQGFVNHALVSLHIDNLRGTNTHHQIETVFKAFGRALRMAIELDPRMAGQMPSTKGCL